MTQKTPVAPQPEFFDVRFKLQFIELSPKTNVIANQPAGWCGDPLQICGFSPKLMGIPTPVCALARNDTFLITARQTAIWQNRKDNRLRFFVVQKRYGKLCTMLKILCLS